MKTNKPFNKMPLTLALLFASMTCLSQQVSAQETEPVSMETPHTMVIPQQNYSETPVIKEIQITADEEKLITDTADNEEAVLEAAQTEEAAENLPPVPINEVEEVSEQFTSSELETVSQSTPEKTEEISLAAVDEPNPASDFEFDPVTQTITDYLGLNPNLIIPETINGVPVAKIGPSAFARSRLESVVIPSSIKSIDRQAFGANATLSTIQFAEGLKSIGEGAFIAAGEETLDLPATLEIINRLAFSNNSNLTTINFKEGLAIIGQQAFFRSGSLNSSVDLPSTLEHLMTSAFNATPVSSLNIAGSENSSSLVIHSGVAPTLDTINFESAEKNATILFNARGDNRGTVNVNLGRLSTTAQDIKALQQFLQEKVNVKLGAIYTNRTDSSGLNDQMVTQDLVWDLSQIDFSQSQLALKSIPSFKDTVFEEREGYIAPNPQNIETVTEFNLVIDLLKPDWLASDFTYQEFQYKAPMKVPATKFGISGFSQSGLEKLIDNQDLVIPYSFLRDSNNPATEQVIEGILPHAFANSNLRSVTFANTKDVIDFVIGTSAFANTGLETVNFAEGLVMIDSGAFQNNELTSVSLPSTVWKVGNSAFADNRINELILSDDMENLQLDNYSFMNNQLTEVELPFSVFKFLDYVFKGNPGLEPIDPSQQVGNDPENTGVVYLYTRNADHLGTSTYISPSPYHNIILTSGNVNREPLWQLISNANKLKAGDFPAEAYNQFAQVLADSKEIFSDGSSDQASINIVGDQLAEALGILRASAPDKTVLRDLIHQGEELASELFTPETWQAVAEQLEAAKTIIQAEDTDNELLQSMTAQLQATIDQLVISEKVQYTHSDFEYDGQTITGFSHSGREKFIYNKYLVLPDVNPEGLPILSIGQGAFEIPTDQVDYGTDVVESPHGIKTLILPNQLERIENSAFRLNNLSDINLPDTLQYIGDSAFNGNQLQALFLPDSVTEMGLGAFSLNQLIDIHLSAGLTEIADGIFARNINLSSIVIPEGIVRIGSSAFMGAPLRSLILPSSVELIDSRAFASHRIAELMIPGTVKQIANSAFSQNVKFRTLTNLILGEGIETIGDNAFKSGLLQVVQLPFSLLELGNRAFSDNLDANKENIVVQLLTGNLAHLDFNNDRSTDHQLVIYDESLVPEENSGEDPNEEPENPDEEPENPDEDSEDPSEDSREDQDDSAHPDKKDDRDTSVIPPTGENGDNQDYADSGNQGTANTSNQSSSNTLEKDKIVFSNQDAIVEKSSINALPATGEQDNTAILSAVAFSILAGLGLITLNQKKEVE